MLVQNTNTTEASASAGDDILSFFPTNAHIKAPTKSQETVLKEIQSAYAAGYRVVLLEAPVGSGKSAVAVTVSRKYGTGHIITPRKSLQDQYFDDFHEHLSLMKGRAAYPCTIESEESKYVSIISRIESGKIKPPAKGAPNCSEAPCRDDPDVYAKCTRTDEESQDRCLRPKPCPYGFAMSVAQRSPMVVHNIHSFIFQTKYSNKFEERDVLIMDECHELPEAIRDFISKTLTLNNISEADGAKFRSVSEWFDFLLSDEVAPEETELELGRLAQDATYMTRKKEFLGQILALKEQVLRDGDEDSYVVSSTLNYHGVTRRYVSTTIKFVPKSLGSSVENLVLSYGKKVLLMSGTIYSKEQYCKYAGINPKDVYFIRIASSFPVQNRPIYVKPEFQTDTSYANWADNYETLLGIIEKAGGIFKDVKGLVHTPSYYANEGIVESLKKEGRPLRDRVFTHTQSDFTERLQTFYEAEEPLIFFSPICQQGVDFKNDRARFQLVLRVPNLSTSDAFVAEMLEKDYAWYNYQSLIVFGQQIGRVNRSASDFGATILVDSRFNKFIAKNSKVLPKWLKDAIVWK